MTIEQVRDIVRATLHDADLGNRVAQLYVRWQDEREYEDIADYAAAVFPLFATHGVAVERATKRPFGFVAAIGETEVHFTMDSRGYFKAKPVHSR